MIYARHNVFENIANAVKYSDKKLFSDIFANETADIIATKKEQVIKILKSAGIDISDKAPRKKVISAIVENIGQGKGKDLASRLWAVIRSNNRYSGFALKEHGGLFSETVNKGFSSFDGQDKENLKNGIEESIENKHPRGKCVPCRVIGFLAIVTAIYLGYQYATKR